MIAHLYRILQGLSIDVTIGAVILFWFFSGSYEVTIQWSVYFLLASSVWLTYTVDHLRDAKMASSSKRERYLLHRRHSKILYATVAVVLALCAVVTFFLPIEIIVGGGVLAVFCVLYLIIQRRLSLIGLKELYVALMYVMGILIAPISLSKSFEVYPFILLFTLTFLNLLIFSWFEIDEDRKDDFHSIATQLGKPRLEKIILVLTAFGFSVTFSGFQQHIFYSSYALLAVLILASMVIRPEIFHIDHRYRAIGDGIFILPILSAWL